jgi:protein tyrosine phosphatase (PTP) superfamily phosphohydrolase (DUF442 family)
MNDIYNFLKLNDDLFCSGMPKAGQLATLADNGVQVVINLATTKSEGWMPDEKEAVEKQGIRYYHIPVEWENPTKENLNEFMNIMDEHKDKKMFVHCQANFRATGFITLYRIIRLGWTKENAFKDLNRIWNPAEYPVWEKFMNENLSPK